MIASLIAPSVGIKNAKVDDFIPAFARVPKERPYVESTYADLRVGLMLDLVSQELLDTMED